jgi:cytochrome c biogenesis factor
MFIAVSVTNLTLAASLLALILLLHCSDYVNIFSHPHNICETLLIENSFLGNTLNKLHPPLFFLSFSFLITQLLSHRTLVKLRISTVFKVHLVSALALLTLGGWWAYQEGTWGGWWNWDASEVFSLFLLILPLVYFHGVLTVQQSFPPLLLELTLKVIPIVGIILFLITQLHLSTTSHSFGIEFTYALSTSPTDFIEITVLLWLITLQFSRYNYSYQKSFMLTCGYKKLSFSSLLKLQILLYLLNIVCVFYPPSSTLGLSNSHQVYSFSLITLLLLYNHRSVIQTSSLVVTSPLHYNPTPFLLITFIQNIYINSVHILIVILLMFSLNVTPSITFFGQIERMFTLSNSLSTQLTEWNGFLQSNLLTPHLNPHAFILSYEVTPLLLIAFSVILLLLTL